MFLGNIISEQPVKQNGLFFITDNLENVNREIPTLIIGWDFSKRVFSGTKLSILNKMIDKNTFWTFTKKEKRIDYEKDLKFFMKNSLISAEKRIIYQYVNVLTDKCEIIKNLIKKLTYGEVCYIYIHRNSFIYIHYRDTIIGVDLNSIDFLKVDRKKVYKILYRNGNKVFFSDDFLSKEVKENIGDNNIIIPYLYAIKNDNHN